MSNDEVGIENMILESWANREEGGDIFFVGVKCKEVDFLYPIEAPADTNHECVAAAARQQHIHFDRPEPASVSVFHVTKEAVDGLRRSRNWKIARPTRAKTIQVPHPAPAINLA